MNTLQFCQLKHLKQSGKLNFNDDWPKKSVQSTEKHTEAEYTHTSGWIYNSWNRDKRAATAQTN